MTIKRMNSVMKTYWLVLSVFLIYHHPISLAVTFSRYLTSPMKLTTVEDESGEQCYDWEEYDGVDCVCASDSTSKCSDDGGMVCDNKGRRYRSLCHFSLNLCKENVPPDTEVSSCGACKMLRLTGGKDFPHGTTLSEFERIKDDVGLNTRYRSLTNNSMEVFYNRDLNAWVIGQTNNTGTFVAMVQMLNGSYPEDSNPGMMLPKQNGSSVTWESDSSYSLECIDENQQGKREKRFFFTFLFVVTMVTAVTVTTLKVVQAARGCLYYPSVCKMRDEIKHKLLPEVTNKRDQFISTFGRPSQFEGTADKIHSQVTDIRDKIITIRDLHTSMDKEVAGLIGLYTSLKEDFVHIKTDILSGYTEWEKSALKGAELQLNLLPLEFLMAMPTLLATSASTLALAASGIGAVLAVGFAIVDIVSSVREERKVRDQLRDKKNTLNKAKNNLIIANSKMNQFQKKFCQHVVKFLYEFSKKSKQYNSKFQSLYSFISRTYGHSSQRCNYNHVVSKSTRNTLERLSNNYLKPVVSLLSADIEKLKHKIQEVKETNAFLNAIENKISKSSEQPSVVFTFIKTHKPKLTSKMFKNLFGLLRFISKSVLPKRSCYWGHSLSRIRQGDTTLCNYMEDPVCESKEIKHLTDKIVGGVQNQLPVCRIARQVHGTVFRTRFRTIRYISDFVLPTKDCYWGYDMKNIRETPNRSDINKAKIDSNFLATIESLKAAGAETSLVRQIMKGQFDISNRNWQTFIAYHVWHKKDTVCPTGGCNSTCFPSTHEFSIC